MNILLLLFSSASYLYDNGIENSSPTQAPGWRQDYKVDSGRYEGFAHSSIQFTSFFKLVISDNITETFKMIYLTIPLSIPFLIRQGSYLKRTLNWCSHDVQWNNEKNNLKFTGKFNW